MYMWGRALHFISREINGQDVWKTEIWRTLAGGKKLLVKQRLGLHAKRHSLT